MLAGSKQRRPKWLETNTIKLLSTTRTQQKLIAPLRSTMAKVIMPRVKNMPTLPSSIRRLLTNIPTKPIRRANSKSR